MTRLESLLAVRGDRAAGGGGGRAAHRRVQQLTHDGASEGARWSSDGSAALLGAGAVALDSAPLPAVAVASPCMRAAGADHAAAAAGVGAGMQRPTSVTASPARAGAPSGAPAGPGGFMARRARRRSVGGYDNV